MRLLEFVNVLGNYNVKLQPNYYNFLHFTISGYPLGKTMNYYSKLTMHFFNNCQFKNNSEQTI